MEIRPPRSISVDASPAPAAPDLRERHGRCRVVLVGSGLLDLVRRFDHDRARIALGRLLCGAAPRVSIEARLAHASAREVWTALSVSAVRGEDGAARHIVLHVQDVSERRRFECRLRHLADHDPLTGLLNRRRFAEELSRTIAMAARYGQPATVLAIDLDDFKGVNDAHGHAAGDKLLASVADVMRARLRGTDLLGRLGGDEFAAILPHADAVDAAQVAEALVEAVAATSVPTAAGAVAATVSIGVAGVAADALMTPESLLAAADEAMYAAKRAGRNCVAGRAGGV